MKASPCAAALRREANRGDAGTETFLQTKYQAAAADRLGATCAATLEGIVAIAAPPPFLTKTIGISNTGANTTSADVDASDTLKGYPKAARTNETETKTVLGGGARNINVGCNRNRP